MRQCSVLRCPRYRHRSFFEPQEASRQHQHDIIWPSIRDSRSSHASREIPPGKIFIFSLISRLVLVLVLVFFMLSLILFISLFRSGSLQWCSFKWYLLISKIIYLHVLNWSIPAFVVAPSSLPKVSPLLPSVFLSSLLFPKESKVNNHSPSSMLIHLRSLRQTSSHSLALAFCKRLRAHFRVTASLLPFVQSWLQFC